MFHVLWTFLNIGLFLFFFISCIKVTNLLREKLGRFTAAVFVFGLFSFIGNSGNGDENTEPNTNQIKTWKFNSENTSITDATYIKDIDLEETLISKLRLGIVYGKDQQGQLNIPVSANSSTSGLVSGTSWKTESIDINRTVHNNQFQYFVRGIVKWKLLGATVYTQLKNYNGIAKLY